ncbi:MAG: UDP-glucuronic acid decarboxylase family protein [Ferrimicrobium sp.]
MRILITGGAGFLGSNLAELLLARGDSVICLDDLSTGRKENIQGILAGENFKFVEADVCDPYHFEVDQIYNLACPASPPHYQRDPVKTTMTCVLGMKNALDLARETGATVLQASTSEVYGDPDRHPQSESYRGNVNPIGPRSCYDEGKRVAESLCFDYQRYHGVKIKVARIFNTYGPRMRADDGRVISNMIVSALNAEPLTVYGDGSQTRSFCYVDDLLGGLTAVMNNSFTSGPYNVGNPDERTVLEVATIIKQLLDDKLTITHLELPIDDPRQRCPDIALLSSETDWKPTTDFATGLVATIAYFVQEVGIR